MKTSERRRGNYVIEDGRSYSKKFNSEMLTIARRSRGLNQGQLAKLLSINQSHLSKIEAGLIAIPEDILMKLPKVLGYHQAFFYRADHRVGIEGAIIYHRMRQSISRRLLDKIEAQVNIYRMHISDLLRSVDIEECKIYSCDIDEYEGPSNIASTIRASWRLPSGPIQNLVSTVESAGGIVIPYDFGTKQIDGLSQWIPTHPPLFFINTNIPPDRFRMSLAHELGHIIMHAIPRPNMEEEAFEFAAELLTPKRDIGPSLQSLSFYKLADLKSHWGVSMAALIYRAEKLRLLSANQILSLRKQMAPFRVNEPVDIPKEEPTLLSSIIGVYLNELGYNISQICSMLSIDEKEFHELYNIRYRHLRLAQ